MLADSSRWLRSTSPMHVLSRLGKPSVEVYNSFVKAYKDMNKKIGKEQYLVPYLMSSHPAQRLRRR